MKILLTGASSYVGAGLYLNLSKKFDVVGTYYGTRLSERFTQLDVTNAQDIDRLVTREKPHCIIHAAANANARWCEANPALARALNQESTKYIVESANKVGASVLLVSSFAALHPDNIYGKSKQESEKFVRETRAGFIILRPSLVIGFSPNTVNDRPFNRILKNLDEKTEAVYDTSWKFQPTYLRHISEVIESVLEQNIQNEEIPIAVPELKSRYDIAKDILEAFHVHVTPIDKKDTTPVTRDPLKKLESLGLPRYTYEEIVKNIVEEINDRKSFSLP